MYDACPAILSAQHPHLVISHYVYQVKVGDIADLCFPLHG